MTEAERQTGQHYRIDLELELDLSQSARSDDVADTVDYSVAADLAISTLRERPFNLIESAAQRIADRLLNEFPLDTVTVRLAKLLPPVDASIESAAVEIIREPITD